jgi:phosphatidylserine/phosphatidylglycerophosphate/cardiolipin synthase-like enzyme
MHERALHVRWWHVILTACAIAAGTGCGGAGEGAADAQAANDATSGPEHDAAAPGDDAVAGSCALPAGEPQKKAIFVDQYPDEDLTIEDAMVELIDAAMPGSKIRIAVFTWTRAPISEALVQAHERGVDVRAIADQSNLVEDPEGSGDYRLTRAVRVAREGLGDERMVLCNESTPPNGLACIGTGINHNKFLLFSELCDGSRDVVVQSSANFTNPQLRAHNNSVIIRDDAGLFAAYEAYWDDLHAQQTNLEYYVSARGDTGTEAFFFPRGEGGSDPAPETDTAAQLLGNIDCTAGSRVRVAMAFWTGPRAYLVDALRAKHDQGCDVRIIVDEDASSTFLQNHLQSTMPAGTFVITPGVHHKYFLADATYLGAPRQIVWTGSHNFTGPALRTNDEALLQLEDEAIFEAFEANWNAIWESVP